MNDKRPTQYHQPLTDEQKKLSDLQLARQAAVDGKGISVLRFYFWDVVARLNAKGKLEYIVTDSSDKDRKPQMVHGPCSKEAATTWAKREANLWRALTIHHPDDEPLSQFQGES